MFRFASPEFFFLLLVIAPAYLVFRLRKPSVIDFSSLSQIKGVRVKVPLRRWILWGLRVAALVLIVAALARPQQVESEREFETKGIDIVLALDISGSMLAEDFKPVNRLVVAKEEAKKFVKGRQNDRIGLVVFARQSYTQCPLTLDYDILNNLIENVETGIIKDGTAIGLAIANAVNRLRESDAKSKIIILLTDGGNNAGNIDPITAAELAKGFGIRVYTIGIGRGGMVPFPIEDPIFGKRYVQAQVDVDHVTLKRIADITGGIHFIAGDARSLGEIYKRIDELEKTEVKVKEYTSFSEHFHLFLIPGALLLCLEIILAHTVLAKIP